MSLKKLLFFALIFCGLSLYIYKYEIPQEEKKAKEEFFLKGVKNNGDVLSIQLTKGTDTFKLLKTGENDGKTWRIADLPTAKVDEMNLNGLLSSLTGLKLVDGIKLEPADDLASFGLKDPEVIATVEYVVPNDSKDRNDPGDIQTATLHLGKKSDYLAKRYIKRADSDLIYMTADAIYESTSKSKHEFRSKSPVAFDNSEIKEITLFNSHGSIKASPKTLDEWSILEPIKATGSSSKLQEVLREIKNFKAQEFIDPPATQTYDNYLKEPNYKILINWKDEKKAPLEVLISQEKQGESVTKNLLKLSGVDTIFSIEDPKIDIVNRSADELRDRNLMQFDSWLADELFIKRADGTSQKFVKKTDKWFLDDKEQDVNKVATYMSNLGQIEAQIFPNETDLKKPEETPEFVVEATLTDKKKVSYSVYNRAGKAGVAENFPYYVWIEGKTEPFYINKEDFDKMTNLNFQK